MLITALFLGYAADGLDGFGADGTASSNANDALAYTDSFSFLAGNEAYASLYEAINNCMDADEVETRYEHLKTSLGTTVQDWMVLLKASANCAHYHLEVAAKKNSKRAKELISYAYSIYEALEKANVDDVLLAPLHFSCLTMDYLAHPLSISKGLESVSVIDSAYEANPTELSTAVLYAARKLNAPAIGGGDVDEAFGIYLSLLSFIEGHEDSVSPWDAFDVYSGVAKCYDKKKDEDKAVYYYERALDIYPKSSAVIEAIEAVSK